MTSVPVLRISTHSPPGQTSLSSEGHGFDMTSFILKSVVTSVGPPVAPPSLSPPGVVLFVATQSLVASTGSSCRLVPEGAPLLENVHEATSI